jgi:hypothetical protein
VANLPGHSLYHKFVTLGVALQYAYPEISWDQSKFSNKGKKSLQRWLKVMIEELLPGIEIVEEYQHPELNWGLCFPLSCCFSLFQLFSEFRSASRVRPLDSFSSNRN